MPPRHNATWGEQLYAFLEQEWEVMGITRGAWCRIADLPDSTVYRWRIGHTPDLASLCKVADALGRSREDVLIAAGVIEGRKVPLPRQPATIKRALREDPEMTARPKLAGIIQKLVDNWGDG